jgi:hypothetical protein
VIKERVAAQDLITNEFIDEINRFDPNERLQASIEELERG